MNEPTYMKGPTSGPLETLSSLTVQTASPPNPLRINATFPAVRTTTKQLVDEPTLLLFIDRTTLGKRSASFDQLVATRVGRGWGNDGTSCSQRGRCPRCRAGRHGGEGSTGGWGALHGARGRWTARCGGREDVVLRRQTFLEQLVREDGATCCCSSGCCEWECDVILLVVLSDLLVIDVSTSGRTGEIASLWTVRERGRSRLAWR
ncbi:hypothetical protein T439DRAFT_98740 [Meredithblackwellia eburnea MCA 4105]